MDSVSGEIERLGVKTWSWKLGNKNHDGRWISPQFSDDKYFDTLSFVIYPNMKNPEYGRLMMAEECRRDDLTYKRVYGLQVVLTYTGKEKVLSIETKWSKKTENVYMYYLQDIKTSNLLKITCTFLKIEVSFQTVGETGKRNVIEERTVMRERQRKEDKTFQAIYTYLRNCKVLLR